jgi:membrane protein implicated in regulation of membrane protease activity
MWGIIETILINTDPWWVVAAGLLLFVLAFVLDIDALLTVGASLILYAPWLSLELPLALLILFFPLTLIVAYIGQVYLVRKVSLKSVPYELKEERLLGKPGTLKAYVLENSASNYYYEYKKDIKLETNPSGRTLNTYKVFFEDGFNLPAEPLINNPMDGMQVKVSKIENGKAFVTEL